MEQTVRALPGAPSMRRLRSQRSFVLEKEAAAADVVDLHAVEARSEAPTAVLDRDQRTVRVPVAAEETRTRRRPRATRLARPCAVCRVGAVAAAPAAPLVCDHSVPVPPKRRIYHHRSSSSPRTKSTKSSSSWFPVGSVIRWLLAALCLLALLPPRAMAAPTRGPRSPRSPTQPKWISPCGLNKQDVDQELQDFPSESPPSVSDLLTRIVIGSKNALDHAVQFRQRYVEETFQKEYTDHHNTWKPYKYDWLPDIPKQLGEKVAEEHLQKQTLEVALKDIYQYLQKYAVGLEQVVMDQKANGGDFKNQFVYEETQLRNVLCEVQVAIAEQGVVQHPDVSPDIMAKSYREMNQSYRNVRDWIILREYMNGLEYIIQMLEFLGRPQ